MNDYAENSGVALSPLPSQGMTSPNLPVRERALRRGFWRVAVWFIVLDVLIAAFVVGVRLRQFMWIHTDTPYHSMRFDFDIENAHHWGSTILRHATAKAATAGKGGSGTDWKYFLPAYFELYQQVIDDHPEGQFGLDYTPARLLVAALWVRHEKLIYPHVNAWVRPYPYTAPLLWFNTICEMIAALGAFLLVRHWVWRGTLKTNADPKRADSPVPTRAWVVGLVAALLIWFNPAMLYDAHVFPQWEVWLLPSFFFAAWFASRGNWLLAGLVVPIGMMLKGQLAIILPIFILWPLFEGNWRGALRFVIGFLVGSLILVLPWLVRADFGWLKVSFIYPTGHWRHMAAESDNLAAILENFGWTLTDPVFTIRARWLHLNKEVPIKTLLVSIYTVCLVLCAWGMSRKNRRNDPAFLIALTAPWLLMFATLTQMHERYLLWAAVTTAITVAVSAGWGLLHVWITLIATSMIVRPLLGFMGRQSDFPRIAHFLHGIHPGIAWAVLTCAAVFLYAAIAPHRRGAPYRRVRQQTAPVALASPS